MRIARERLLSQFGGTIHQYWRCHNRDMLMEDLGIRKLFLKCVKNGLRDRKLDGEVKVQAFCMMSNHGHQIIRYAAKSKMLSKFFQLAHSEFGRRFNKLKGRTGTYNNGRPKTVVIQETERNLMRAQMYIEANPIRAKMFTFENLKNYPCSSFAFYAFGIVNEFTEMLDPPQWYLNLGDRPEVRQARYRSLFKNYLGEGTVDATPLFKQFCGAVEWVGERKAELARRLLNSDYWDPHHSRSVLP